MKIMLEQSDNSELEVIIRGNLSNPKVSELISAINSTKGISKLSLYQNKKEYLYDIEEIYYFYTQNNKVMAYTNSKEFEVHYKIYELIELLKHKSFVQISKGVIVNVNFISSVEPEFSGNYTALLKNSTNKLTISRSYMKNFRKYIMEGY